MKKYSAIAVTTRQDAVENTLSAEQRQALIESDSFFEVSEVIARATGAKRHAERVAATVNHYIFAGLAGAVTHLEHDRPVKAVNKAVDVSERRDYLTLAVGVDYVYPYTDRAGVFKDLGKGRREATDGEVWIAASKEILTETGCFIMGDIRFKATIETDGEVPYPMLELVTQDLKTTQISHWLKKVGFIDIETDAEGEPADWVVHDIAEDYDHVGLFYPRIFPGVTAKEHAKFLNTPLASQLSQLVWLAEQAIRTIALGQWSKGVTFTGDIAAWGMLLRQLKAVQYEWAMAHNIAHELGVLSLDAYPAYR